MGTVRRRWVLAAVMALSGCASHAQATRSGVGVVAEGCGLTARVGSGVVLDSSTQVVTVAHTVAGATALTVVDSSGAEHAAVVSAFDKDADLAVLSVPTLESPALRLGSSSPGPGTMLTWHRDEGVRETRIDVVKRLSITIEDIYVDEIVQRAGLEIAGPVTIGDSGGPVLNADGDVIGIVYASSRQRDGVGFASDRSEIEAALSTVAETTDNGTCS